MNVTEETNTSVSNTTSKALRYAILTGLGFLCTLVALSYLYWQERVVYADAAYQIFSIINAERLAIQVQRFGAVIVQFVPLVLVKCEASLDTVLKAYSLCFTVYPLVFALIIWKGLNNVRLALLVVLFFALTQVHTFYWVQSELTQGCLYVILGIAIITRQLKPNWWLFIIWQLLVVLITYAHPLSILLFFYVVVWFGYKKRAQIDWRYYSLLASIALILLYKYKIATIGDYDALAMGHFEGFEERIFDLFSLQSTKFFFSKVWTTYYFLPAILVITTVFLVREKSWWNLALMYAGTIAWLLLILITYFYSTDQMYIESYYLPLGIFIGLPFVYYVFGTGKTWWIWPAFLLVIVVLKTGQIVDARNRYTNRLNWMKSQYQITKVTPDQSRFYMLRSEAPPVAMGLKWAIPYETMLLSGLDDPTDINSISIIELETQVDSIIQITNGIPAKAGTFYYHWFNRNYFDMKDEKKPLKHLHE